MTSRRSLPLSVAALLVCAALAAACGQSPATEAEPRIHLDAPVVLELVPGVVPVVVATVDGRPGLTFLLDTGADGSSVDLRLAREHGFEIQPLPTPLNRVASDGRSVEFDGYVSIPRIELGPLVIEDLHAAAIEKEEVEARHWFGILGQDVLGRMILILDAERGRIHALPESMDFEDLSAYVRDTNLGPGEWKSSSVTFRPRPALVLKAAAFEGGKLEVVIDTGATVTSFPSTAIAAMGLEETGTYIAHGSAGRYEGKTYHLRNLDFQGRSVSAEIADGAWPFGLLGMDILSQFVVLIDAPHGEVWFHYRE